MQRILTLVLVHFFLIGCSEQKSAEEYLQLGSDYADKQQWSSAVIELKNAIKQDPENGRARFLLGKTYLNTRNTSAAIKELSRARSLGYDADQVLLPLGRAYILEDKPEQLLEVVNVDDVQSASLKGAISALRAAAHFRQGANEEGVRALNDAKKFDENHNQVRLSWAKYEAGQGNAVEARRWLQPMLDQDVADAWSMLGELEQKQSDLDAAEKAFTKSINLRPYAHIDSLRRGQVRIGLKKYVAAQADLDVLKKQGIKWPSITHAEGVIAFDQQDLATARAKFESVLSDYPDYRPSQYILGLVYFREKSFQNSLPLLEQYTAANPNEFHPNFIYAASLLALNKVSKAVSLLEKLKQSKPDDKRLLTMLGSAYLKSGQAAKAVPLLKRAVELDPQNTALRVHLGQALLKNKTTVEEGRVQFKRAIELDPSLTVAQTALYTSYVKAKEYKSARSVAQAMTRKFPDHPLGYNLHAHSFLIEGDEQRARSELERTRKQFPQDTMTAHNLAQIYLQGEQADKAVALYLEVEKHDPDNLKNLLQLALLSAQQGKKEEVTGWLVKAHNRNPDDLVASLILADHHQRNGDLTSALEILNSVDESRKNEFAYLLVMANVKIGIREPEHAIRLLKAALATDERNPNVHFLLAKAYALSENARKMRESLNATLQLAPDHLGAHLMLARLELVEGNKKGFAQKVQALYARYPENEDVRFLKAKLESGSGDLQQAIGTLTELLEKAPHSNVMVDLARNQWRSGDRQGAISNTELWVQEHQDDTTAMLLLAQFYLEESRYSDAQAIYKKLDSRLPDNPLVLNNLAWLLKDTDPQQGIKFARRALDAQPDSPYIQDTLSMLYLENGDVEEALRYSRQAARALPDMDEIQLNYARILAANERSNEAKQVLNSLLKRTSSQDTKRLAREQLNQL